MIKKNKPLNKIQKIITIVALIAGASFIGWILLNESIITNLELNKITEVDLNNDYFITDGVLLNNFHDIVIFPDDKLTYRTTLINNYENDVNYFVSMTLMQGGQPISTSIELENRTLIPNGGWTFYQTEFFVGDEGTKELKINFIGKNPETDEVIIQKTFSKDLQIQSLSDKIQSDQTNTLLVGVVASSLIGIGTLTALYFNQKTSKEEISQLTKQNTLSEKQIELLKTQNDDLKEQQIIQNRPWMSIVPEAKIARVGDTFEITLKNYGETPAHKVIVTSYVQDSKITENDIVKNGKSYPESDYSPEESFIHTSPIPNNVLSSIQNNQDAYIGLILTYSFGKDRIGRTLLIIRWVSSATKFVYETKKMD